MKCAIVFTGTYGSTKQYAQWLAEKTGFPVFDVRSSDFNLASFDALIIGTPVYYYKLVIAPWIRRNLTSLQSKKIILFTVSGAPGGSILDGWISESLPPEFIASMQHFALRGRMDLKRLSFFHRMMIKIGGLLNSDPDARKEEWEGFDYMDRDSIAPVVEAALALQSTEIDCAQDQISDQGSSQLQTAR